ncbi:MAG: CHAP domain-containing protein [Rickettsiaceae bacterium]|nr:CHAP domain-containing protein [Rickettsiaceae bacterium]
MVYLANVHHSQHPIEIGGNDMGPWVRTYMSGQEGAGESWCAGFASFIMLQAATILGVTTPIATSVSCTNLAHEAQSKECFLAGADIINNKSYDKIKLGSLILFKEGNGWHHTGIVIDVNNDGTLSTIEGNTNGNGSNDGYEVYKHVREISIDTDFAIM